MSKKEGPAIHYCENKNPHPDADGKNSYHPELVALQHVNADDFVDGISHKGWCGKPELLAAIESIKKYSVEQLSQGAIVAVGNMMSIRVRIRLKKHLQADGTWTTNIYHEGDRIPADDIEYEGLKMQPTKEFEKEVGQSISHFERWQYAVDKHEFTDQEILGDINQLLDKDRMVTISSLALRFGLSRYKAGQVLKQLFESNKLDRSQIGHAYVYFIHSSKS